MVDCPENGRMPLQWSMTENMWPDGCTEPIPELIVMLTQNDRTVANAAEIFDQCRGSRAHMWGFKEEGLPPEEMRALFHAMKDHGMTTFLEVVTYTEPEGLAGAQLAVDCGCDVLMGTMYAPSIHALCQRHGVRYMPFVGQITGRPSVLEGTISQMVQEAKACLSLGVDGFDLLGYRYTGNAAELNRQFVAQVPAPVCLAGSINSYQRLDEVLEARPWAITIGSAFFENCFDGTFCQQIDRVCAYLQNHGGSRR